MDCLELELSFNSHRCAVVSVWLTHCFLFRIQTAGLGGMKPNTVMLGWPSGWRQRKAEERSFLRALRAIACAKMSLLLPKGTQFFPDSLDRVSGNIDIWFVLYSLLTLIIIFGFPHQ